MAPTAVLNSVTYVLDHAMADLQQAFNSDEVRGALLHLGEAKSLLELEASKAVAAVDAGIHAAESTLSPEATTAPEVPVAETSPAAAASVVPEVPAAPVLGSNAADGVAPVETAAPMAGTPEAALASAQAAPAPVQTAAAHVTSIPVQDANEIRSDSAVAQA